MYSWILFDLTGVISTMSFLQDMYEINGKMFEHNELEKIYGYDEYYLYMTGQLDQESYITDFLKNEELDLTLEEFNELKANSIKPMDGMESLIKDLSEVYKLGILTNEGVEWAEEKLDACESMREYFDEVVISAEIGVAKPDRVFFEKSLEILGAKAEECVFIDDRQENVDVANEMGFTGVLFEGAEKLRESFQRLEVTLNN